jgi:Tol biopolymer transport system component
MTDEMKLVTAVAASTLLALVACASSVSTPTSTVAPPRGTIIFGLGNPGPIFAIAPDGTHRREIHAGSCCPRMSLDGTRIVVTDFAAGKPVPATLGLDGSAYTVLQFPDPKLQLTDPWAFSPDGTRIAGEGGEGADDAGPRAGIYTFRWPSGAGLIRVDASPGRREFPISFSPDGSKILFVRQVQEGDHDAGPMNLYVVNADGTGLVQLNPSGTTLGLTQEPVVSSASWSSDGREVAFTAAEGSFSDGSFSTLDRAVFVVESGGANPRRITPWGNTYSAVWSPSSRWIAFASNAGGTDLFVVHPDGAGLKAITSAGGGLFSFGPAWSPDSGKLLFVRSKVDFNSTDLWTVNVDGSNLAQLTHLPATYNSYTWIR